MKYPHTYRRAHGITLIELMVALAIGSVLVMGLVEVFAASRVSYQLSTGLARVQENGRFAMDFLTRDLRMAGHLGCVNDQARFQPQNVTASRPGLVSTFLTADEQFAANYAAAPDALRFDAGLWGYDAKTGGAQTGSGGSIEVATTPVVATSAGEWVPAIPGPLWDVLDADTGRPVKNSDIVFLRFFAPIGAQLTGFTPGETATITFAREQSDRLTEGADDPGLFGIADCLNAAVFHATTFSVPETGPEGELTVVEGSGANESGLLGMQAFTVGQAMLYRAESVVYYVGINGNGNPSLYRVRYEVHPGAAEPTPVKEELVEGIESLQLEYGLDSQILSTELPTGNIGRSLIASDVEALPDPATAWRRVGLIQIGVVARSPEPAAAPQRSDDATPLSVLGVRVTPANDGRYRTAYEGSVALRNRLFGN